MYHSLADRGELPLQSQEDVLINEEESLEENKHRVEDDEDTYTKEDIISLAQNNE